MKRVYTLLMLLCPLMLMGQYRASVEEPFWLEGYFKDLPHSYIEVVSATGYDAVSAKEKAVSEVISRRSLATGTDAQVRIKNNQISVEAGHDLVVKARVLDEYCRRITDGYVVYLLVQTAKNPTYSYEHVTLTDKYDFSARAFVPGMAQIHKGSTAKGLCIIAAEALAVGSIIVCENQRATYKKKMREQPQFAQSYDTKASNWETGRNISIGVAAGIWVYNVIDAIVARGEKHVKIRKNGFAVHPVVMTDGAGLSFAYRF